MDLEHNLYGRLLDVSHVDMQLDFIKKHDAAVVAKTLMAPGQRQTAQVWYYLFLT